MSENLIIKKMPEEEVETIRICPQPKELSEILNNVRCPHCNSNFKSTSRLKMHLAKSHKVGKLEKKNNKIFQYFCPEKSCKYALIEKRDPSVTRFFSKLKYLKQHYHQMHMERNFVCDKCKKCFITDRDRQHHIDKECQIDFTCFVCSSTYNTRMALLTHCRRKNHGGSTLHVKKTVKPKQNITSKERKIIPKTQENMPMEDIAAAALSELSWKVVVRKGVDVGVQTDHRSCSRRRTKKDTKTQTPKVTSSVSTQTDKQRTILEENDRQRMLLEQTDKQRTVLEHNILDDIVLPQSHFTSSTQTASDEFMLDLGMFPDIDQHVNNHTQTELINQDLMLGGESPIILSDTHTQTMDLDDYSHNYTQTCHDIFFNDFVELSDIETQTAWASLTMDPCLVTAQTQTLL